MSRDQPDQLDRRGDRGWPRAGRARALGRRRRPVGPHRGLGAESSARERAPGARRLAAAPPRPRARGQHGQLGAGRRALRRDARHHGHRDRPAGLRPHPVRVGITHLRRARQAPRRVPRRPGPRRRHRQLDGRRARHRTRRGPPRSGSGPGPRERRTPAPAGQSRTAHPHREVRRAQCASRGHPVRPGPSASPRTSGTGRRHARGRARASRPARPRDPHEDDRPRGGTYVVPGDRGVVHVERRHALPLPHGPDAGRHRGDPLPHPDPARSARPARPDRLCPGPGPAAAGLAARRARRLRSRTPARAARPLREHGHGLARPGPRRVDPSPTAHCSREQATRARTPPRRTCAPPTRWPARWRSRRAWRSSGR